MKKVLTILAAFIILTSAKEVRAILKKQTVDDIQNKLGAIYQYVDKSNLPHQDVLQLQTIIREISTSLGTAQIDSIEKK